MNWIKVSERLPEDGANVCFYNEDRDSIFGGYFQKEGTAIVPNNSFRENLDDWWFDEEKITHWMPLPDLPKDEE